MKIPSGFEIVMSDVARPLSLSPNHWLAIILTAPVVKGDEMPIIVYPTMTHQKLLSKNVNILIHPPIKHIMAQSDNTALIEKWL